MINTRDKIQMSSLPVMEAFYTIQGEGFYTGTPAYFIRLAGCDVGCVWCDVKSSWDQEKYPKIPISKITTDAKKQPARLAVITGGEPLTYDLTQLTETLKNASFRNHIETSGVYPLTGVWDWICFSPKKFKKPQSEFYHIAHELKVVIYHKSDFAWAETHAKKMNKNSHLFLQVEWERRDAMLPQVIDYVKSNPKWKISIQTHKYIHVP